MKVVDTGDGSRTLYSERYAQTFHSDYAAAQESRHVFLNATGVSQRLAAGEATRILEIGFGSGLNALLSADQALHGGATLHFTSLEHALLDGGRLRPLQHASLLREPALAEALYAALDRITALPHNKTSSMTLIELTPHISLEVIIGDAREASLPAQHYDAVYLDAFSPDSNAELWTEAFFAALQQALRHGGHLATYSAKGCVRRALASVGFSVEKRPGPPGKREMLLATRTD